MNADTETQDAAPLPFGVLLPTDHEKAIPVYRDAIEIEIARIRSTALLAKRELEVVKSL
jgi:hypothetical protein